MAKLTEDEAFVRKIAWGRLGFLKMFVKQDCYTKQQKLDYIEEFRKMYESSNLDEAGMKMANNKLDFIIGIVKEN